MIRIIFSKPIILLLLLVQSCQIAEPSERPEFEPLNARLFKIDSAQEKGVVTSVSSVAITGVKFPFNASILKNRKGYFLIFREIDFTSKGSYNFNKTGYVTLNDSFKVKEGPFYFNVDATLEDVRALSGPSGRVVLVGNHLAKKTSNREMVLIEAIETNKERLQIFKIKPINSQLDEKNWSPFFYEDELFLTYNLETTHKVISEGLLCDPSDKCSFENKYAYQSPATTWTWGKLRGGTPAKEVMVDGRKSYLSFFHSVHRSEGLVFYFMGALIFEGQPPFRVLKISKAPIVFDGMYRCGAVESPILRKDWLVSYPVGLEIEGDEGVLSLGVNDSCIKIITLDLPALFNSMKYIK
ncbi:MAG: hypothetical protein V4534_04670 [Myxococcota bacterium]